LLELDFYYNIVGLFLLFTYI